MNGLSLCAGIGGLDLGLEIALGDDYRTVCYVEREAFASAALVARMDSEALDRAPIFDDLESFPCEDYRGRVDLISAGFPCQPWSVAGSQQGTDDERWIWPLIADIIRRVEPRYVFLENVPGLIAGGGLEPVLGSLAELGFNAEWSTLRASDIGASHQRNRVFILAYRAGRGLGELRQSPGRDGLADGGDAELAHAGRQRRQQVVRGAYGEEGPHEGRAETATDESSSGREPLVHPGRTERRPSGGAGQEHEDTGGSGESSEVLGDAESFERRRGVGQAKTGARENRERRGRSTGSNEELELFPPGPGDLEAWARILADNPEFAPALEPDVCGMVAGFPDWLVRARRDRLRALGNAVVPLQAAAAFSGLARRIGNG